MPVSHLFACLVECFRVREAGAVESVGDEPARVWRVDEHGRRALPDFEERLVVHDGSGYASRARGGACAIADRTAVLYPAVRPRPCMSLLMRDGYACPRMSMRVRLSATDRRRTSRSP